MKRLICTLILVGGLSTVGMAQDMGGWTDVNTKGPFVLHLTRASEPPTQWCDTKCKVSIGIYAAGSTMDIAASVGHKELNPFFRDERGYFTPGRAIIFKAAFLGGTFAFQRKHPRVMFWVRTIGGAAFGAASVYNWSRR